MPLFTVYVYVYQIVAWTCRLKRAYVRVECLESAGALVRHSVRRQVHYSVCGQSYFIQIGRWSWPSNRMKASRPVWCNDMTNEWGIIAISAMKQLNFEWATKVATKIASNMSVNSLSSIYRLLVPEHAHAHTHAQLQWTIYLFSPLSPIYPIFFVDQYVCIIFRPIILTLALPLRLLSGSIRTKSIFLTYRH